MGIKQLYNDNLRKLPNKYGDVSVMLISFECIICISEHFFMICVICEISMIRHRFELSYLCTIFNRKERFQLVSLSVPLLGLQF